ncbi:uncharacterized protein LOC126891487 [Diabrotica virgifera virgifera]|uniref:MADF domain-containing protein n=1 Tax=Diabrotica virgifera virgifera TaxID=50390 RepID=A0ABM5L2G0_DIAVI|nr:uncharacterized protein LOC126891487 [Diabrotica virgifera virgifera]
MHRQHKHSYESSKTVRFKGSGSDNIVKIFDTDKFITFIQEKPALWDKSDKKAREKAWIEVGENFYDDWAELDAIERHEKGKEMKNKWRNIRDNFLKSLSRGKSGDPAAKTRKYASADSLHFLFNTVEKRSPSGNIEVTEDHETGAALEDLIVGEEVQPASTSSGRTLPTAARPASRQQHFTPFQSALIQTLDDTNTDLENEDPDRMYILSLLSDFKKLKDEEKLILNL